MRTIQSHVGCGEDDDEVAEHWNQPSNGNFVFFTVPDKWKCASPLIRITSSSVGTLRKFSENIAWFSLPRSLVCCTSTFLYKWKFESLCSSLHTLLWHECQSVGCFLAERRLLTIACLTAWMFGGVFMVCTEAVNLKFCIYKFIVLLLGTLPWRGMLKCRRNNLCVVTTGSLL